MPGGVATLTAKPFVKWVGGKGKLMPQLLPFVPISFNDYYEPFLGGGALYFSLPNVHNAHLNDINTHLINAYKHIRDDLDEVIHHLKLHHNQFHSLKESEQKQFFLEKREEYNSHPGGHPLKTALLIFLNKTCFNGLYRENKNGHYNVPFGKFSSPPLICNEANLQAVSEKLKTANFYNVSYKEILKTASQDDFVYIDPPYYPLSTTSNFTSYHAGDFTYQDQVELRDTFKELDARGCFVMLSNSASEVIKDLYQGFRQEEVMAARAINSKGSGRGKIKELLIMNY